MMYEANQNCDRLGKLKAVAELLAKEMDKVKYSKDLPPLTKQYRETIREIEEIEGNIDNDDDIAKLLSRRDADGKTSERTISQRLCRPHRAPLYPRKSR